MTENDDASYKLLGRIGEGLAQQPAYLLWFGLLVVFLIVMTVVALSFVNNPFVIPGIFVVFLVALILAAYVIRTVETSRRIPVSWGSDLRYLGSDLEARQGIDVLQISRRS